MRKATLASILHKSRHGVRLNEHLEHPEGALVFQHACKLGAEDCVEALGIALQVGTVARTGSSSRNSAAPAVKWEAEEDWGR